MVAGGNLYAVAQRFLGSGKLWVKLTNAFGAPFTEAEAEDFPIGQVVCIPGQSS